MNNVDDQPVLIKLSQIQQMTSMSKAFVYLLIQSGEFPKQVKIGRSSFWVYKEVKNWIDQKAAQRAS